ncbi:hypothetical protein [Tenacibaculum jejuense]|uniref:Uncharacterized protein n=1 Tax=Tenacibaculum jejuense TaxID=584609 RepID=A0A238UA80_9FLAO|nr:hypothetical protein [Tenacibaculum jejuense]SNR15468.1 protein of unknown function [Tenacibaculum jejuense]
MKKITVQIVTAIFLLSNISCSNEKELVIDEQSQNIALELPDNAISLQKVINDLAEELGKTPTSNRQVSSPDQPENEEVPDQPIEENSEPISYKQVFVLYPEEWTAIDRLLFYQSKTRDFGGSIFVIPNSCINVETWYIPVTVDINIRIGGIKDRAKNLIVASNSGLSGGGSGNNAESDEDNPQLPPGFKERYYHSCEEVILGLSGDNGIYK